MPRKLNWTEDQLNFLKNNYRKLTRQQISDKIGISIFSISRKAAELNLGKQYRNDKLISMKDKVINTTYMGKFNVGEKLELRLPYCLLSQYGKSIPMNVSQCKKVNIKGIVKARTQHLMMMQIQNGNKESFKYKDFATGDIEIL